MAAWRRNAIRRMIAVRRSMLAQVAAIPKDEVLRPRTLDQWSVKDVLGHLLSCDEETLRRFRLIEQGRGNRIVWFESMAFADRFNARTVARTRRYGLPELSEVGTLSVPVHGLRQGTVPLASASRMRSVTAW